jgi:glycosyltransferase involved in cell wall biosynthesis
MYGVFSRTMEEKVPLSIIYLGKRGGGAKITSQIVNELKNSKMFSVTSICLRSDNELIKEYDQSNVVRLFNDLVSLKTFLRLFKYVLMPKKLRLKARLPVNGFCLIPMISPLGMLVESILRRQGITVIRLLHDFEKHPGDKWPPNALNRHIVKHSKFLIALSNDVAGKIMKLNPKVQVSVYPHPSFDFITSPVESNISSSYLLFVGRIRAYKGVENLISAFTQLEIKGKELVIAGEGKLRVKPDSRIKFINRWLGENEIASLVKNAEVVIFPYIEASQSGILPYCVSQNKKIVVTPLPGLLDQISTYKNAFITEGFEVEDLTLALISAIQSEVVAQEIGSRMYKNIEACLLESSIFAKK